MSLRNTLVGIVQSRLPRLSERIRMANPAARKRRERLQGRTRSEVFTEIHSMNEWASDESLSGDGSTMLATEQLRSQLPRTLERLNVGSLVDVPCGDFNWMSNVDLGGVQYTGIDIVPSLISELRATHQSPTVSFELGDVAEDELPEADAVLCRDLLLHLSLDDASMVVQRLTNRYQVCLISTNPEVRTNTDIVTGETRHLNLNLPPFNLPAADHVLADPSDRFPSRVIGVWVSGD